MKKDKEREREKDTKNNMDKRFSRDWNPWRATPGRGSHTFRQGFSLLSSFIVPFLLDIGSVYLITIRI